MDIMQQKPILLIDGRNAAYRAYYAGVTDLKFRNSEYHYFIIWLRFIHFWLREFSPSSIHIFWDCHKHDIWRCNILKEYKAHRDAMAHAMAHDRIDEIQKIAFEIMPHIGCRQYMRNHQEADDLIYAACNILRGSPIIIISSDSDMSQIPYLIENVRHYEPKNKIMHGKSDFNPIIQKALMGDKADNIDGYLGIGKKKSELLARNSKALIEFLDKHGDAKFKQNIMLIDISINPNRINNELYIRREMNKSIKYDRSIIMRKAMELKITGLGTEYSSIVQPFKSMVDVDSAAFQENLFNF